MDHLLVPFPSSRTLTGRLYANRAFAKKVIRLATARDWTPVLAVGNDHLEGSLLQELAGGAEIPTAIFLRSSEIKQRDFLKYQCDRASRIFVVHPEMRDRVLHWLPQSKVCLIPDGIDASEFYPPKPKADQFPLRILVAGSESHHKGWQDLAAAVDLLEQDANFPAVDFDFTGRAPDSSLNDMRVKKSRRSRFHFIGRVERFQELVRQYGLVIHPSRGEAFGLAMVEVLAAGVPLLCSRVGVIEQIQENPAMLFQPCDPPDQAETIRGLWLRWRETDLGVEVCQRNIRRQFLMDDTVVGLASAFRDLSISRLKAVRAAADLD